ncbi:MAG: TIGR03013 family XrtA/PEP-CTERM system glycosyltransferase [Thermodesulfobacteriota bacterium]|nr:TIGR03013 family XrtA/PEP-CTERM system glycosyltransferase [Thermodesulfobacteriota bacterium]
MLRIFNQYYPIRNILFFLMEGALIFFAVIVASYIRFGGYATIYLINDLGIIKALLITLICQICLYYFDLYDFKVTNTNMELGVRLLQALGISSIILAVIYYLFPPLVIGRGIFLITLFFLIAFVVLWRLLYNWLLITKRFAKRVLIIGSGDFATDITKEIFDKKDSGFYVVGFLGDNFDKVGISIVNPKVIGTYNQLPQIAEKENVDKIVIAIQEKRGKMPMKELLKCRMKGIEVEDGTTFYERLTGKMAVENLNPSSLIFSEGFSQLRITNTKRLFELILSVIALVLLSPLFLITSLLIKLDSSGPVFFYQKRVGKDGEVYRLVKFRSMRDNAESYTGPVWAQTDDDRITRVGRIIRKTRIDELPQLFNVMKGHMSIVGPRPERPFFVKRLEGKVPYYSLRLCVKPGITGWAQIKYSYGASIYDSLIKLQYDIYYIKNMSMFLDLLIIFETIKVVLFGKGAR